MLLRVLVSLTVYASIIFSSPFSSLLKSKLTSLRVILGSKSRMAFSMVYLNNVSVLEFIFSYTIL